MSAKLIAGLARIVKDVGVAEDLAQDALVAALERWPESGVPDNPGAWLMATAKHRAIDAVRRDIMLERKHEELARELDGTFDAPDLDAAIDDHVGDDLLRLMLTICHPVLSTEARVALTLRLLGGLTTDEIARAFLVSEPTVAQRIVRAKRTLREARVPFEVPRGAELASRVSSVLEVIQTVRVPLEVPAMMSFSWSSPRLWVMRRKTVPVDWSTTGQGLPQVFLPSAQTTWMGPKVRPASVERRRMRLISPVSLPGPRGVWRPSQKARIVPALVRMTEGMR